MAIKFLSAIDLGGLEIQNSRFQHLTSVQIAALSGGSLYTGRMVYDSTNNTVKFYDGSDWLDVKGDIQAVTAGTGLSGGGTSGAVTLNVDMLGLEDLADPNGDRIFFWDDSANASKFLSTSSATGITITGTSLLLASIPNSSLTNSSVTVTAGDGLTGGGEVSLGASITIDVGASDGIEVTGDNVRLKNATNLTNNKILLWDDTNAQLSNSQISESSQVTQNGTEYTITIGADETVISGNLTVQGTTTSVNSNEVNIGDSIIKLNSDETGSATQNAGFEVERGTDTNVSFLWDETEDYFTTVDQKFHIGDLPAYTVPSSIASQATGTQILVNDGTTGNTGVVRKMSAANFWRFAGTPIIFTLDAAQGGVSKSGNTYTVTHDLQTKAVIAQVIDTSTFETIHVDVARPSNTTVTVAFGASVTDGDYMIVLTGARRSGDTVASAPTGPSGDQGS